MIIYYLQDTELGWDNLVGMSTTRMGCIKDYTDGEVTPQNDEEVDEYLKKHRSLRMDYKILND